MKYNLCCLTLASPKKKSKCCVFFFLTCNRKSAVNNTCSYGFLWARQFVCVCMCGCGTSGAQDWDEWSARHIPSNHSQRNKKSHDQAPSGRTEVALKHLKSSRFLLIYWNIADIMLCVYVYVWVFSCVELIMCCKWCIKTAQCESECVCVWYCELMVCVTGSSQMTDQSGRLLSLLHFASQNCVCILMYNMNVEEFSMLH